MALKILSIPATSAASERNWSAFSFIHIKLCNRLHNERVEKIVFIYWNLKILRKLQWPLSVKEFEKKNVEIGINNSSNDTILIDDLEEHNWEDSFLFDYEELDFE